MFIKFFLIALFFYSPALQAFEKCESDSQKIFCRLLRCVDGTQWKSAKILDPFQIIKEDESFEYNTILMPVDNDQSQFSFLAINSEKIMTYSFPENLKVGPQCKETQPYGLISLTGHCRSVIPFGLGCLFQSPSQLKVKPYKVSYWDGRKVGFLCTEFQKKGRGQVKLTEKSELLQKNIKFITMILKNKMRQLVRAIKADRKNINIESVVKAIKNGHSVSDTGDCRYFLDGNTLNLVLEEINKPQ